MEVISSDRLKGRVRIYEAPSDNVSTWTPVTDWNSNLVVYEWGSIVGHLLNGSGMNYSIGGMYLEFQNMLNPATTVTPPTQDRTRSVSYYNNLAGNNNERDYLRVPLTATQLLSSDADVFPHGNQCVFFARSAGTTGVHGKPFSDTANTGGSKMFGASLVSFIDNTDATQDLILSSFYFATSEQQIKLATSQTGIEWELTLQ